MAIARGQCYRAYWPCSVSASGLCHKHRTHTKASAVYFWPILNQYRIEGFHFRREHGWSHSSSWLVHTTGACWSPAHGDTGTSLSLSLSLSLSHVSVCISACVCARVCDRTRAYKRTNTPYIWLELRWKYTPREAGNLCNGSYERP